MEGAFLGKQMAFHREIIIILLRRQLFKTLDETQKFMIPLIEYACVISPRSGLLEILNKGDFSTRRLK
jgi:hypothetical protein